MRNLLCCSLCVGALFLSACASNTYNIALYNKDVGTTARADAMTTIGGNRASAQSKVPVPKKKPERLALNGPRQLQPAQKVAP
jgi:uncharacterized lipoprotein YmbA